MKTNYLEFRIDTQKIKADIDGDYCKRCSGNCHPETCTCSCHL